MKSDRQLKFRVGEVQNPVEVKFIIDHSELGYLTNALLLAKELGEVKGSGFLTQSGRCLMTIVSVFHQYVKMARRNNVKTQ